MKRDHVLVINPGSTSTKIAVYQGETQCFQENLIHDANDLAVFSHVAEQFEYRKEAILKSLERHQILPEQLIAVVGRGGLLRPMPSGTYKVTMPMIKDLQVGIQGEHASNLGGILAKSIADSEAIESYIVDPVAVDEFIPLARISGIPQIKRKSLVHALNIRAIAKRYSKEINKPFETLNLIVAHLGGGISIAPIKQGKIIDVNNANEMGPFSPERVGSLPVGALSALCFSGKYNYPEMKRKMRGRGGLVGYLGTNDARDVLKRIEAGDEEAKLVFDAMGYQIAKEIGAMATVIEGKVDAILITGGVAYAKYLTDAVESRVKFIAPVFVMPGEDEMGALNLGVLSVLGGKENAKIYEEEVVLDD